MGYEKNETLDLDSAHATNSSVFYTVMLYSILATVVFLGSIALIFVGLMIAGS